MGGLKRTTMPFTAIVGLDKLKLALILNGINPQIGGVLISGPKGTGKTTVVRALADLLPDVATVDACDLFYGEVLSSKTVDKGLYLHGAGTITNGVSFAGTVTNALDFATADGVNGAKVAATAGAVANTFQALVKIDIAGTAYYIPAWTAAGVGAEAW